MPELDFVRLSVENFTCDWELSMRRVRVRARRPGYDPIITARRWVARWRARHGATLCSEPEIIVSEDFMDYFIRNRALMRVQWTGILGGERFGLGQDIQVYPLTRYVDLSIYHGSQAVVSFEVT